MANITLPGNGEVIATHDNPSGNDVEDVVLVRSDALGTPITADANGLKVQLGAGLPGGANALGTVGVTSVPADPFGANSDAAATGAGSINAHLRELASNGVVNKAGTAYIGKVRATDGTNDQTLLALSSSNATPVGIVDSTGVQLPFKAPAYPTVTPTLSTSPAYQQNDSLATAAMAFTGAAAASGGTGWLASLTIIDDDDGTHNATNGQMLIHFFSASVTPGTANAAYGLASDAENASYLFTLDTSTDGTWYDHGPGKAIVLYPPRGPAPYRCVGSTTLYAAVQVKNDFSAVVTAAGMDFIAHLVLD